MNTKKVGDEGEEKAAKYLIKKGYSIIQRNFRTRTGEIDIIGTIDNTVVFFEVKTLPNGTIDMIQKELNLQKRKRILKTAKCFLLKHRQYSNSYLRFDVVVIDMPGFESVYHIENAFTE